MARTRASARCDRTRGCGQRQRCPHEGRRAGLKRWHARWRLGPSLWGRARWAGPAREAEDDQRADRRREPARPCAHRTRGRSGKSTGDNRHRHRHRLAGAEGGVWVVVCPAHQPPTSPPTDPVMPSTPRAWPRWWASYESTTMPYICGGTHAQPGQARRMNGSLSTLLAQQRWPNRAGQPATTHSRQSCECVTQCV